MNEKSASTHPQDTWSSGDAYERYVGRWSRLAAREFIAWLELPPKSRWLDLGCGTGALSQTILQVASPALVKGIDRSPAFAAHARQSIQDERATFGEGDAQALSEMEGFYDAVVSGLALNFFPQPGLALGGMVRAVKPGGWVAAYIWDYAGKMQFMRAFWDAAAALEPTASDLDEGRRFPLCRPEPLAELFTTAGLKEVEVRAIDIPTRFKDFDDYWSPFLGGQGPAPSYVLSLSAEKRAALRERIRASLPFGPDGSLALAARAWGVRGMRSQHP